MIGYSYAMPWQSSLGADLREIADVGYKGIDIWRPLNILGEADDFKSLLERTGLIAVSIAIVESEMMREETVEYASAIGTKYIMVHKFIDLMDEKLVNYADNKGIKYVIHPRLATPIETIHDISKYLAKYPKLMLCPDIANLTVVGSDPVQVIEMFQERLGFIHLKDWKQTIGFCELGEGSVDIPKVFRTLRKINYSGWLVVDCAKLDSKDSAIKCRDYLKHHRLWR